MAGQGRLQQRLREVPTNTASREEVSATILGSCKHRLLELDHLAEEEVAPSLPGPVVSGPPDQASSPNSWHAPK
ncbi:hypothetical protein E2C01_098918 [Portunus trituberculatus]|uniref:Uncharacterized protein n=1 Tax=Portunus trituberculatus TaxID=210409 RepID=A0A5B7KE29_PORTR|nr:hypothetical protein [Portunus trituberculatus]